MRGPLMVFLLSTTVLAGCLSGTEDDDVAVPDDGTAVSSVWERAGMPFDTEGPWSQVLEAGPHAILDPLSVHLDVALPPDELGAAGDPADPPQVHLGLWLPDVPEGTPVPVIADIGPYYGESDTDADEPAGRLGRFLIENFVPHGYAVAQVSVFGTGQSNHCMDLMGRAEQLGVDAAVTWLGSQEWSNGRVGLTGRSYDGSTPWQAAAMGNPHLATIAPISGLIGVHELMWRNGSAEFRGPVMHNVVYGTFGMQGDLSDRQQACRDYATGPVQGLGAYLTGDHFAPEANDYWAERYFLDRVLENYEGSVYFIHGLQDWNVDPHMAFPAYQRLQEAGIETKGLFGQWAHNYPDRLEEHQRCDGRDRCAAPGSVRYDWAQDLLEWFDHYLQGDGDRPALHVEVQDDQGAWRVEDTWPPEPSWQELAFADAEGAGEGTAPVGGPSFLGMGATSTLRLGFAPLDDEEDTRIAGLVRLPVTVTPTGPGGQLFAEFRDAESGKRLGHAVMDLRFHAGGQEMRPVVPGVPIVAQMEFFAMDVVLPAGHGLDLVLSPTGEDYLPSAVSAPVLVHTTEESHLCLPLIEVPEDRFFQPPGS